MTLSFIGIVLVTLTIAVVLYFYLAPQLGKAAEGERLQRMENSTHYRDGKFHNLLRTPMDMSFKDMMATTAEMIKGDKHRAPEDTIKTTAFDFGKMSASNNGLAVMSWFGHSSVLLQIEQQTLLIDPVFGERASMFSFMGPKRYPYSNQVGVDQLPEIDAVLISHDHYDHLDYPTFKALKGKVKHFYVPLGVGAHLEHWGVDKSMITELDWWEEVKLNEGLELVFTPSRHFSGRGLTDRFHTLWGAWVIKGKKQSLFFGGDSGYFSGFSEIGEKYGPFDLTMLECGQYNKRWRNIHMMPEETVQAHIDLKGKLLMPIHWGKFTLALHAWKEPIERAAAAAKAKGVAMHTPVVGEVYVIPEQASDSGWWTSYN